MPRMPPTGSRHNAPGMVLLPLLLLLRFVASSSATASSRSPATALFVLGDSTVSCAATTLPINLTSPSLSGLCLFPSSRRFLPDLLAAKMGLPPPPHISTLNGTADAVSRGVNFGGQYGEGGVFRMGAVGQQLRLAAETLQVLQLEAATPRDASAAAEGAVFVMSFGTDAYARLLARGPEADAAAPKHGRRGFGRLLADRIARTVSELYEADVRRVAVMGVAPLGCAPRVMWEGMHLLDGRSCVEEANELIQGYNARLAAQLDDLRPQLPGADIVFCDVYKGMIEIISNPGRYGFEEAREACCGLGPFKGTMGCFSKEMACRTPERHVWWDLYSPTEAVDSLVANWSWSPPPGSGSDVMSICSPITLQQLASML
ncbi:GDSL esterase/lipase At1g71250-like [Phragmites australis]|uniref:GDSL esterase/lipase At1g71250-like n=1 Tax=Phragmites australis TaxID=29695 RepID=UPI002D7852EC|nr:GDSL esterase/lipase At1g71250-like [Phragmites australis]